ncbi:MAG: hypothetical protein IPP29_14810 [Bacteroidetes bacterium]|nr:hypothetical protein [Bacteroidota bacterium]
MRSVVIPTGHDLTNSWVSDMFIYTDGTTVNRCYFTTGNTRPTDDVLSNVKDADKTFDFYYGVMDVSGNNITALQGSDFDWQLSNSDQDVYSLLVEPDANAQNCNVWIGTQEGLFNFSMANVSNQHTPVQITGVPALLRYQY